MTLGLVLWGIVLIAALALEAVGTLDTGDRWPTLTDIIRRWVPKAIIVTALLWMARHFGVTV